MLEGWGLGDKGDLYFDGSKDETGSCMSKDEDGPNKAIKRECGCMLIFVSPTLRS